jgi:malonyl-CoA decarboxylase
MSFSRRFLIHNQGISFSQRHGSRKTRVKSLVLSAAWVLSYSRRSLAIIAEGKGRSIISNSGDIGKIRPATGVADVLKQFANRIGKSESPDKRAKHHQTPVAATTSHSSNRATLRSLALTIFHAYPTLPWYHPEKQGMEKTRVIQFLADDCSLSHDNVLEAAQALMGSRLEEEQNGIASSTLQSKAVNTMPSITRLQQACTPEYERIITRLLQIQADQGLSFLLLLRRDLLNWISYQCDQPSHDPLLLAKCKEFDNYLCRIFQTWFAPGMLRVERITYETTSASVLERIARNEAVHPVRDLQDLRRRLGPDRRVFCVFHPLLQQCQPLLVLHVALTDRVPDSMTIIHNNNETNKVVQPRVATFYSISNFETGLKGVGLGEYLIYQAVDLLRSELPSLQKFCTLSPLPKFRSWLQERTAASAGKADSESPLDAVTTQQLAEVYKVGPDEALTAMVEHLQASMSDACDLVGSAGACDETLNEVLQKALLKLAAHYLVHEKRHGQPLDPVGRFHIGNGALIHAIRFGADTSRRGWYNLERLVENQAHYEQSRAVPMSDNVRQLVET